MMTTAIPSIACLGVIGRNNNPLHMSVFPSHDAATSTLRPIRTALEFSLLLSSTVDVFDLRRRMFSSGGGGGGGSGDDRSSSFFGDSGAGAGAGGLLLHAVDDRLAAYGFETNTGVRMVCVVDMRGRRVDGTVFRSGGGSMGMGVGGGGGMGGPAGTTAVHTGAGLRDAELKPVFRAMQDAYVQLLQNPFHVPDEHSPLGGLGPGTGAGAGAGGAKITSRRFADKMRRIGEAWTPGVMNL